jgi:two-component system, sensor histidine kinase
VDAAVVPDTTESRPPSSPAGAVTDPVEPTASLEVHARSIDILVVDDDPRNLTAIEVALGPMSAQLVKARSGAEALRQLLERDFALVLLDVQMPGLDGFETAKLIRERARSKHIPIVFVTAYQQEDREILRGYELGAVDFLFKPIIPEVLRAKARVFVELDARTEEVRIQAERLRALERQNFEQRMQRERDAWRADVLRQQMEEQRRINTELAEADRQKNEFLAMLGHELRNPLAPVLLALQLMQMEGLPDPKLERARAAAERQIRHLTRLVDDLLDVARIERGKIELQLEELDFRDVVRQALETTQPTIEGRHHRLTMQIAAEPLTIQGDSVRLVQVVGNLLHNAARYTEPGGVITVDLRRDGDQAVLTVTDTGLGIAPELLSKVFDTFVQARRGQGLGLGLTLVKRMIEQHGGSVGARSEGVGKGSTFEVRLKTIKATRKRPSSDRMLAVGPELSLRVVVVDDNDDVRETMREVLETLGHRVWSASDGATGVALIAEKKPHLALLDVGLPDMDGMEVARRVREQLGPSTTHLVAITGYGQVHDRKRCLDAGFDEHLVKPASADSVRRIIAQLATKNDSSGPETP